MIMMTARMNRRRRILSGMRLGRGALDSDDGVAQHNVDDHLIPPVSASLWFSGRPVHAELCSTIRVGYRKHGKAFGGGSGWVYKDTYGEWVIACLRWYIHTGQTA